MPDLNEAQSSQSVKVVGATGTGSEANFAAVTPNNDFQTADILNNSAADTVVNLTTSASAIRTGVANLANRKYVVLEALSTNVKWGFSSGSQSFDLFKSQLIMIPTGPNVTIWARVTTGTGQIAVGELS